GRRSCAVLKIGWGVGIYKLILYEIEAVLPRNHTRLIGKYAKRGRGGGEIVRAGLLLDSMHVGLVGARRVDVDGDVVGGERPVRTGHEVYGARRSRVEGVA